MLKPRVKELESRLKPAKADVLRHTSRGAWDKLRIRIMRRDGGVCRCAECRRTGAIRLAHQVDHIVPAAEGGTDDESNLQAINRDCHKAKTAAELARRAGGR
jgi:5-methylcytosine-specific restriction protein A